MANNKSMLGPKLSVQRDAIFCSLRQLAVDNETYFVSHCTSLYGVRLSECCHEISVSADLIQDLVKEMHAVAHKCDYDENTPGNGFRSLIYVCDMTVLQLISILRVCSENRSNLMFRVAHQCKEVEGFAAVLRFLILAFQQVVDALERFDENSLFPPLDGDYQQHNMFLRSIEDLDTSCFYARPLGFQFAPSVTRVFRVIGFILATYSLSWEKNQGPLESLFSSGKFLLNPEQRALRIVKVIRESDIEFCKGFWNLSELGAMCNFFATYCAISEMRDIPLCGPLPLRTKNDDICLIPEPSAHTGSRPVRYRVISCAAHEGLSSYASNRVPNSSYLVIHCHGGGYVATSSKSHESYLRGWAKELACPLISIDYSLAPENPYPRPMEEVLYAYAYILNNPSKFGWTGEKVIMCGDSAGGNLVVCATMSMILKKVKRLPDALVPIYTPFLFQYLPSPSRVLSFMDPLLHMGVVIRCAAAYTNVTVGDGKTESATNGTVTNGHKSLYEYVDQVQKSKQFVVSEMFENDSFSMDDDAVISTSISTSDEKSKSQLFRKKRSLSQGDGKTEATTNGTVANGHKSLYEYVDQVQKSQQFNNSEVFENDNFSMHDEAVTSAPVSTPDEKSKSQLFCKKRSLSQGDGKTEATTNGTVVNGHKSLYEYVDQVQKSQQFNNSEMFENDVFSMDYEAVTSTPINTPDEKSKFKLFPKKRSLSQSLADTAALAAGHAYDNISGWFETVGNPIGHNDKPKLNRSATLTPHMAAKIQQQEAHQTDSNFASLLKLSLPRDPLISPLYASHDLLRKLPPIWFVACHLDPLLDDTIMFARKVRAAGGQVQRLDLLDSVPHGFLNFALVSPDCLEGSKLCVSRIREALGIPILQ